MTAPLESSLLISQTIDVRRLLSDDCFLPTAILIDECDVPIQNGFEAGCLSDVIDFMRDFLSALLKDNPNLNFAVLT